jgi:hypothetical protein
MVTRRTKLEITGAVVAVVAIIALAIVAIVDERAPSTSSAPATTTSPHPAASVSPVQLAKVGGVFLAIPDRRITDPTLMPYPFMSPTPSPGPSVLDGTYLRTISLREVGGARYGLPVRCLRCPPYRIDAGVSTLIFINGAYYVHHQISGFKTMGSFVIDGDRVTLFNDANCPQTPGTYRFEQTAHGLRFTVVEDDCPFSGERSDDLEYTTWTHVPACVSRIVDLWPGEVAC